MTVKRLLFDVEYTDDPAALPRTFRTRVVMRDRLDAEQHGHKYGIVDPAAQPQALGLLWLFYSARREGHIPAETTWDEFTVRTLDNTAAAEEEVPPTKEAPASSSSSPTTSPASTSPAPTTD